MAAIHSDEFKRDAVRIALASDLTKRQAAFDLGIGRLTPGKWVRAFSEEAKMPVQNAERLRKENRTLKAERAKPKKRRCSLRLKSREVSTDCGLSRHLDLQPSVPADWGNRARAPSLEAPVTIPSPASRQVAGMNAIGPSECPRVGSYPRPASPEPWKLRPHRSCPTAWCSWP